MSDTLDILRQIALQVRNASAPAENTAERVGRVLVGILECLSETDIDRLTKYFLRKDKSDTAAELITFLKGLAIGLNGSGITVLADGTSQAVVDRLYVKVKAYYDELQVQRKTYVGGTQIISHAGMKCLRVEEQADAYRCYFLSEQDGVTINNQFSIGSLAICKEENLNNNRYYWRAVTAIGADYIDLSKTNCVADSDIPAAGDDIVALGHLTDIKLQDAIIIAAVDSDSPSFRMYCGINSFSLADKAAIEMAVDKLTGKAYMYLYGDLYIGARDKSKYLSYNQEELEIKNAKIKSTNAAGEVVVQIESSDGSGHVAKGNMAWNADGDITGRNATFTDVQINGSLRSSFYDWEGGYSLDGDNDTQYHDNISIEGISGSISLTDFAWGVNNAGRKMVLTHYLYNGVEQQGAVQLSAQTGKFFYEDGIAKNYLKISRECVELIGYGNATTFFGWIVLSRNNLMTTAKYGRKLNVLAQGIVTGTASGASFASVKTFDGSTLTVTRTDTGVYRINFSSSWGLQINKYIVNLTGYGVAIPYSDYPVKASVRECGTSYFIVNTSDDETRNDGSFMFQIINLNDWF